MNETTTRNGSADLILCDDQYAEEWDEFLLSSPNSSFYQLWGWNRINTDHFSHSTFNVAALKEGKIHGVFPLVLINSKIFGKILCSMPFVNFGGTCSENTEIDQQLLQKAVEIAKQQNVDYIEMRTMRKLDEKLPTSEHKISMTLKLDDDHETVWNNFASKHRTNIRRAYKNNLTVKSGSADLIDEFYDVLSESWRNIGTPIYNKSYFKQILDTFPDNTKIFICYHNESTPIATTFNGYFKDTIEGMWAGAIASSRRLQPNYVLYWEMIKDGCENGFKHFHLGRSSVESGGEDFKKKWKAEAKQLYWQYYLNNIDKMPELNVNNPKYNLAINVWKKLPIKLTTMIGPLISKNIP